MICSGISSPSCTRRHTTRKNEGGLAQDWPRVPLPASKPVLAASVALGREVAALLDPEGALPKAAKGLKSIGLITAAEGTLDPDAGDLGTYGRMGPRG